MNDFGAITMIALYQIKAMTLKNLQLKILIHSGACLTVTIAVIISYSVLTAKNIANMLREKAIRDAQKYAVMIAKQQANIISEKLTISLNTARILAQAISAFKNKERREDPFSREEVSDILNNILIWNPEIIAVYTCWEPNAFDGSDLKYAGSPGHDQSGRLIPYRSRDENGMIALEPLTGYDNKGTKDRYLIVRETKQEIITEPYIYRIQKKPEMIISLVTPILIGETFYGITGVDLRIDIFQSIADDMKKMYDGMAQMAVITHNGTIAAFTGRPEWINKSMSIAHEGHEDTEKNMSAVRKGQESVSVAEHHLEVFTPVTMGIRMGSTTPPWSVNVVIPMEKITASADKQMAAAMRSVRKMAVISVSCGLVIMFVLWQVARSIVRPIQRIILMLSDIADQTASSSEQVAIANQKILEGSSLHIEAAAQAGFLLKDMALIIRRSADHSKETDRMMNQAVESVRQAGSTMSKLTVAMDGIVSAGLETSGIIKAIDDISFQINLLSLNASVEAARVGSAGAGFAVVAGEVRNLAGRSAVSVRNIAGIVEETARRIKDGNVFVCEIREILKKTDQTSCKVKNMISKIAEASEKHYLTIEQLNTIAAKADDIARQNVADIGETAAVAEQLSVSAEETRLLIRELAAIAG